MFILCWIHISWWDQYIDALNVLTQIFTDLHLGRALHLGCLVFISCDQAAVRMSVCNTFCTMLPSLCHHEIFRGDYQWQNWCLCKRLRSKVKVTEVKSQFSHFRTVTPVWIHIWWWNDGQSLMWFRRGALLFFKVICQTSRSHGSKNCWFWPELSVSRL